MLQLNVGKQGNRQRQCCTIIDSSSAMYTCSHARLSLHCLLPTDPCTQFNSRLLLPCSLAMKWISDIKQHQLPDWNRASTQADAAEVDCLLVLRCCWCFTRIWTLRLMSVSLRSPITPWRRFSRFPARLRPFFRCRGSKSIFRGFTHYQAH